MLVDTNGNYYCHIYWIPVKHKPACRTSGSVLQVHLSTFVFTVSFLFLIPCMWLRKIMSVCVMCVCVWVGGRDPGTDMYERGLSLKSHWILCCYFSVPFTLTYRHYLIISRHWPIYVHLDLLVLPLFTGCPVSISVGCTMYIYLSKFVNYTAWK